MRDRMYEGVTEAGTTYTGVTFKVQDPAISPSHYRLFEDSGGKWVEAKDVIHAVVKDLPGPVAYEVGSAFKYMLRLGRKTDDLAQEMRKSIKFIEQAIEEVEKNVRDE